MRSSLEGAGYSVRGGHVWIGDFDSISLGIPVLAGENSIMRVYNKREKGVPTDAVYVGRPTKWGNPFVIGKDGNRVEVIKKYENWLPTSGLDVKELRGKSLVCWCHPQACHADILLKAANE